MNYYIKNTNDLYHKVDFDRVLSDLSHLAQSQEGKRQLEDLKPSTDPKIVQKRLAETSEGLQLLNSGQHLPFLSLADVHHLLNKLIKGYVLECGELLQLADFLRSCRMGKRFFEKNQSLVPILSRYAQVIGEYVNLEEAVYSKIRGGRLNDEASRTLKKIRLAIRQKEDDVQNRLKKMLKDPRYQSLLQEAIVVKKNEQYTLPVKASFKNKFPGHLVEESNKGLTVYMEPLSISKISQELTDLRGQEQAETYRILSDLSDEIYQYIQPIEQSLEAIVVLETIMARSKLAKQMDGKEPKIRLDDYVQLDRVCHPYLKNPVPLSLHIGKSNRALVVTGPNAGGKTIVLKTLVLAQLMAQSGLLISCGSETVLPVFQQIFVSIGDEQSISNSLSTFSAHLTELAEYIREAGPYSLIVVDEIGSGTDPKEGAALSNALLESFYLKGSLSITSTHYGEIKEFAQKHPAFETAAMGFNMDTLEPSYQLMMGETGESNAFWLAHKVHLKEEIIDRAKEFAYSDLLMDYENHAPVKNFDYINSEDEEIKTENLEDFHPGDRVYLNDSQNFGLVYRLSDKKDYIWVDVNGDKKEVLKKRVKLSIAAKDLYPENYDMKRLFMAYKDYKQDKDLLRGSKKAYKALKKAHKDRVMKENTN
ncbi:endonuclease MutS2 [Atopobacter sp. AH10]|uniref:endonuclease MutS2 n=1 Tax=Atopobacter sp. AH10 TaxID=2315861 RepID=UPI000EF176A9|nr:endonuclease MutS2 [Atopobacter sp. AH10]RLK62868.1 endonuclease MutS2 [Atopobacter sp. AH10]